MSASLLPYDVLRHICTKVSSKSDLVSLSLTCTSFNNPALEELWETLPSLIPLLVLMPVNLWSIVSIETPPTFWEADVMEDEDGLGPDAVRAVTRSALAFSRSLIDSDWSRFDWYGRRVRKLTIQPYSHPAIGAVSYIDESVWKQFTSYSPHRKLAPHLRTLILDLEDDFIGINILPYLDVLLRPGITQISIFIPSYPTSLNEKQESQLFEKVSSNGSHLGALNYSEEIKKGEINERFSHFLTTLPALWFLQTNVRFSSKTWQHLACLPTLSSVFVRLTADDLHPPSDVSLVPAFCHLQALGIDTSHWPAADTLMEKLQPQLQLLRLEYNDSQNPFLSNFQKTILRVSSMESTLLYLILHFNTASDEDLPDHAQNVTLLAPLRNLVNLQFFEMKSPAVWILSTALFSGRSCFWPRITEIHLQDESSSPQLKLAEVGEWFRDYSSLQELEAPMVLEPFSLDRITPSVNCISVLCERGLKYPPSQGEFDDVFYRDIVACLAAMFPSLTAIGMEPFGSKLEDRLETMRKLYPKFKSLDPRVFEAYWRLLEEAGSDEES